MSAAREARRRPAPPLHRDDHRHASGWRPTRPAEVEVLGHRTSTFQVEGHHYALVVVEGLVARDRHPVRGADRGRGRLAAGATGGRRARSTPASTSASRRLVFGSCRVGMAQRGAVHARPVVRPGGRRDRRAVGVLAAAPAGRDAVARRARAARRPGLRGRGHARDGGVHPRPPRPVAAARPGGRRLRGVHAAVPRVVDRSRHPLAALHRALDDDLRRPRRARRLEHLRRRGSRRCARCRGGTTASPAR